MNSLFIVKFLSIYLMLNKSEKWKKTLEVFSESLKYPNENYNRHIICSPNIQIALKNKGCDFGRFRLAFPKDNRMSEILMLRNSIIEIYIAEGDFIREIPYDEWDFELSLALESELLGIILGINQY